MSRSFQVHPLSVLVGLALGGTCLLSMSQLSVAKQPWGPPKANIVNIFEEPANVTILPGASLDLYDVPNNRWLTVTGVAATGNQVPIARWAEDLNGVVTNKGKCLYSGNTALADAPGSTPQDCGGAVGWTFRPGSKVVLNNVGGADIQVSSYALIGYLSRE
jgi:hypothetical protein